MSGVAAGLAPGLADPAHDSQRLFRAVLEAFSHPGRIVALAQAPAAAGPLSRAATAFLLTYVDRDTPLWLAPELDARPVRDFVRFHTGAPIVANQGDALFAVAPSSRAPTLDGLAIGSDPYPDRSATLVIDVPDLRSGTDRIWRGPGILGHSTVAVAGLADGFWAEWAANHALFPCGVDVVFAAGSELLALPRSIAVES
jgi:alpha-D-ribose 1-methylphosphonate 5-triphosphate synthase subunit PhnH